MKVISSNHWELVGIEERGFVFLNTKHSDSTEYLIIDSVCLDVGESRVYFDTTERGKRVRLVKHDQVTSLMQSISNILQMRTMSETDNSYYLFA